jgi:subtilisin family serine protease
MLRTALACVLVLAPLALAGDVVAPELRAALSAAAPGEQVAAYLVMSDQLSLPQVQAATRGLHGRPLRAAVSELLQDHAAQSQSQVRALLAEAVAQGAAVNVQVLWMGNAVLFTARPQVIEDLAALPGVDRVRLQPQEDLAAIHDSGPAGTQAAAAPAPAPGGQAAGLTPEPNITSLQAPAVWSLGYDGSGVLICNLDTGTSITHPDLVNRIWVNPGEIAGNGIDDDANGFIDDIHGWDFVNNNNDVTNSDPHGTNTAGIVCGDGSSGVKLTGMAPGVTMVVCQMSVETNYLLGQQYALLMGVDCLTSSNSFKWNFVPKPDYHLDRQICDMELAAEIIHSNSIGNQGTLLSTYPIPFNIASPGNCPQPFDYPDGIGGGRSSVLGCGGLNLTGDTLYTSSGKGPAAWDDIGLYVAGYPWAQLPAYWDYPYGGFGGSGQGMLKPDLMTYTDVWTTASPGSGYTIFGGTSAATPHLGGALALMLDVQPNAAPRHVDAALELTALDKGTAGKDNVYGAGKLRCLQAARRLVVLGRFDTQAPALGETVTLDVFGPPNEAAYAFFSVGIHDDAGTSWNLDDPFFFFGVLPLDGSGHFGAPVEMPSDPLLAGLTAWLQFGAANHLAGWPPGIFLSVPESITLQP